MRESAAKASGRESRANVVVADYAQNLRRQRAWWLLPRERHVIESEQIRYGNQRQERGALFDVRGEERRR